MTNLSSSPIRLADTQLDLLSKPASSTSSITGSSEFPEGYCIPLRCRYSDLTLGKFFPSKKMEMLGMTPYVQKLEAGVLIHPVFGLPFSTLVHKAQAIWRLEKTGERKFPILRKQLLFLALLHAAEVIVQEYPCLPSSKIVETYFGQLLDILGWKHDVSSERLHLPRIRIQKWKDTDKDPFTSIEAWIAACEVCREEWENVVREKQKTLRERAKILAMKSIKKAHYADISIKRLWNWLTTQVPQFELEKETDLEMLFFSTENQIHLWTVDEIDTLEGLLIKHCELGNSISHEITKHLNKLRLWLSVYNDTFTIESDEHTAQFAQHKGIPEPKATDASFAGNRAKFLIAQAKWKLANKEGLQAIEESSI